jgi:hypothetical protein
MTTTEHGNEPGGGHAQKGDGRNAGHAAPAKTQTHNAPDSIAACAESKRFATLRAQFAVKGHTLYQSGTGDGLGATRTYLAERWGMVRHLPTLDDAEQFLIQVAGVGHE